MDNDGIIDIENDVQKCCVSYVTSEIVKVVFERNLGALNRHQIPGIVLML